jgi:hypothetical protein
MQNIILTENCHPIFKLEEVLSLFEKYKNNSYPQDASSIESSFKNYLNERDNIMNLIKLIFSEGNEIIEQSNLKVRQVWFEERSE